jgi:hypothetical protein
LDVAHEIGEAHSFGYHAALELSVVPVNLVGVGIIEAVRHAGSRELSDLMRQRWHVGQSASLSVALA